MAAFVLGDELGQELIQPLGRERRQHQTMHQVDFHLLGRAFPVVIDPEVQYDRFARADRVADVGVTAFQAAGFPVDPTLLPARVSCLPVLPIRRFSDRYLRQESSLRHQGPSRAGAPFFRQGR